LVLYPDITYEIGEPGRSGVDCVESAVKAVIKLGIVEENHIGLIGHSFGGYETSFIATQSKLFAAAVAGAGVTDMISGTLDIRSRQVQNSRYENGHIEWADHYMRTLKVISKILPYDRQQISPHHC
jgi:dipeptidyl aminopeptidase/acylaminoacyl peptidase